MDIKAVINEKYNEIEIHVCNDRMNSEVARLVEGLGSYLNGSLPVRKANGDSVLLNTHEIIAIYAESSRVFVHTEKEDYECHEKLYELEEKLGKNEMFRISKSELVNLKKIARLDMSVTGTIKVIMNDNTEYYTSRRNVTALKKALGL